MTQFNIGGKYLELGGVKLSWTRKNMLFAFDNVELDRTTSFEIPNTAANADIFGLAGVAAFSGDGMRQRYAAILEDGIISKSGYLYLTGYNTQKRTYSACFVTGENQILKDIKESGNIRDYLTTTDIPETAVFNNVIDTTHKNYGTYRYTNTGNNFPSYSLKNLLAKCATHFGLSVTWPSDIDEAYLTPDKLVDADGEALELGDTARAFYNLPQITFTDLIKAVGYLCGRLPLVIGNVLTFESGHAGFGTYRVADVISVESLTRTAADFARNNYIIAPCRLQDNPFTPTDNGYNDYNVIEPLYSTRPWGGKPSQYLIDNDNLDEAKTIAEFPFTARADKFEDAGVFMLRKRVSGDLVAYGQAGGLYSLPVSSIIQDVCTESTTIKASVKMSLFDFMTLKETTHVILNNVRYAWTSAQYNAGVCALELCKI